MKNNNGAFLSPEDKRDFGVCDCMDVAGNSYVMYPKKYMDMWLPPIRNQGDVSSCTAFAVTTILSCIYKKLFNEEIDFSVGGSYGNRIVDNRTGKGQIMRNVVKAITKFGDFKAKDFECMEEVTKVIEEFQKAYTSNGHKMIRLVKKYVRIKNAEDAKAFLLKYQIPLFINCSASSMGSFGQGYHAMACYGYEDGMFHCQNSWGEENCPNVRLEFREMKEVWGLVPMEDVKFIDVEDNRWSKEAIVEAQNDGIIKGFPDNSFKPEEPLTREQIAVIWHRMKKYINNAE